MRSGSRIAIVGAGIAGLVCAKVLTEDGFAVEVFDRAPDIGGVWSETRRYPGLRAQSTKHTYHFSDHPMPADYPRVLDGARMQEYLASYVRAFGLTDRLRLRTEVVAADPVEGGWLLEIRDADGVHRASCDHLIIANGVFSDPEIPDFAGAAAFARAGGQLGHSTQFLDVAAVRNRAVVVVGSGAAAADIATEISKVAADTTMVARRLLWKMPRKVAAGLDAERILLTRTGAAHFGHPEPGRFERLLHGPGRSFRDSNLDLIEALVAQRSGAAELGLVPDRRFDQAHDAAFGLATEGFADQVTQGRLTVRGQTKVIALGGGPEGPFAELSDGQRVRADIVVCATGFQQRVPFLTPFVQRQLTDDDGNFRLYRQILPLDVPHLTFAGYNTSLLSAVSAEIGAHWTAALLTGNLALPPLETMSERIDMRLRWLDQHTGGRHAHGTVTPDAIRDIDELLADIGVRLPFAARRAQWLRPVRPGDYRVVSRRKRGPGTHSTVPLAAAPTDAEPVPADPATTALAAPPVPAQAPTVPAGAPRPDASAPGPAGAQLPPNQAPAAPTESPTVRIPESVAASAVRTTTLPAVDPTARTRPVPEVRPATVPGPSGPIPAPSQFVPAAPVPAVVPRPAPVAPRPAAVAHQAPPAVPTAPEAMVGHQAAAEVERRAAAEQRAAGIAARSNSPTVRIDMRTAQSLADGSLEAHPGAIENPADGDISPPPHTGEPGDVPARRPGDAAGRSDTAPAGALSGPQESTDAPGRLSGSARQPTRPAAEDTKPASSAPHPETSPATRGVVAEELVSDNPQPAGPPAAEPLPAPPAAEDFAPADRRTPSPAPDVAADSAPLSASRTTEAIVGEAEQPTQPSIEAGAETSDRPVDSAAAGEVSTESALHGGPTGAPTPATTGVGGQGSANRPTSEPAGLIGNGSASVEVGTNDGVNEATEVLSGSTEQVNNSGTEVKKQGSSGSGADAAGTVPYSGAAGSAASARLAGSAESTETFATGPKPAQPESGDTADTVAPSPDTRPRT